MKITFWQKLPSLLALFWILNVTNINASSTLDGTSNVVYKSNHYVFRDRNSAQGIVCLSNGFTVLPSTNHGSNVFLDLNISVSGGIDLRGTSTMTLLHDLYLDNGVTFSDSGKIYSYGSTLIMYGDLTIPEGKVLHCGGNLVIDGKGNTLHMGNNSQLFLDNYATVTLCNMVIETKRSCQGQPALTLSSTLSKLAFDNVILSLGDDWNIKSGQLFFHNDVVVTGTSAFIYKSIAPSYIAPHGCLMFDYGTTFSYAPVTDNQNLFVLSDASSTLVLNGCSLLTTHTGLQLSKGRLFFDNKVELNGMAYNKLSTLSTTTFDNYGGSSSYIVATAWSPNEKYLAIGGNGPTSGNELWLYAFTGTTLSLLDSKNYGNEIDSLSWSPDGKYLAVGGDNGTTDLTIYSFDGSTLTSVTTQEYGSNVYGISWSPDGRYLAICGLLASKFGGTASTDEIQVYCFDGKSLVPVTSQSYGNDRYVRSVSWSPDGIYLAVGGVAPSSDDTGFTYDQIRIYRFNGSALTAVTSQPYRTSYSSSVVHSVSWSPNGQYLVIGGYAPAAIGGFSNSDVLRLYSFNGSTLTPVTSKNYGLTVRSISWSPDGRYVAVGGNSPSDNNEIQVYRFDRSLLTSITSQDYGTSGVVYAVSFSQSGKYLAIGGKYATNNNELWIDTCQYINDTSEPANPITFGNSSLGSTYDLDVNILSGARVEITGKVTHDPA